MTETAKPPLSAPLIASPPSGGAGDGPPIKRIIGDRPNNVVTLPVAAGAWGLPGLPSPAGSGEHQLNSRPTASPLTMPPWGQPSLTSPRSPRACGLSRRGARALAPGLRWSNHPAQLADARLGGVGGLHAVFWCLVTRWSSIYPTNGGKPPACGASFKGQRPMRLKTIAASHRRRFPSARSCPLGSHQKRGNASAAG